MESPALRIPPSIPRPHRKPLQPKNFRPNLPSAGTEVKPKIPNPTILCQADEGKENLETSNFSEELEHFPAEVSLGAERFRRDIEKADAAFRAMDAGFEGWVTESEKRLGDLVAAEVDIWRIVRATGRRSSCMISSPFASLRACEMEKRWVSAQFQEIGNDVGGRKSESSVGSIKNKFLEIGNAAGGRKWESSAGYMKNKFLEIGNAAGGRKSESSAGYMKNRFLEIRNASVKRNSESSPESMKNKCLELGKRKSESSSRSIKNIFQEIGNAVGRRKSESSIKVE